MGPSSPVALFGFRGHKGVQVMQAKRGIRCDGTAETDEPKCFPKH